jgi:aspartyl-tRNA(Asn)/glutamyl-tRNA(Gln) amidotransferase subunit A
LMLQVIAGHDSNDPTSSREPVPDFSSAIGRSLKGTRIGTIRELVEGVGSEVSSSFQAASAKLQSLGAAVEEVSIPSIAQASALATTIMFAEAAEFHEHWMRERPQDYGPDVRRTLEAGMLTPAMYYVRAQRARTVVLAETLAALEDRLVLIAPSAGIPAPAIDARGRAVASSGKPVNLVTEVLRFTAPFNITGQPSLAVPIGFSSEGLPLSMQLIGRPFDEVSVLQVAAAYEEARGPLPSPRL